MLLIQVTNLVSHHPVVINMDHVAHFMDMVNNNLEVVGVQIRMKFGDVITVEETVEQIMGLVRLAQEKTK